MKHLPISIVSPIRASGPLWTLFGAIVLFQEMPSLLQGVGMALIFAGCFAFSVLGREEGIHFHRSKWVGFIVLATLVGMLLVLSDWVYFKAIADPEALISILSVLRRCSVLVGFLVGAVIFKEVNKRKKAWVLLGIMVGVLLIILSER